MVSGADVPAEIDRASTLKFVMPLVVDGDRNSAGPRSEDQEGSVPS